MIKTIKMKKIIFLIMLFFIILLICYYKKFLFGNNIIKNRNKEENILNSFQNYNAEITVTIRSNKTENVYEIYQEVSDNYSMQEIKNGENISGMKIELEQNRLKVSNTKLNLEKVYENYEDLINHAMFLNSFSKDYLLQENVSKCIQQNDEIIMEAELKNNKNTYIKHKKLYINSKTNKPTKMEITNNRKNETICIVYNNVEFK